jgi:hypothetical protein
MSQPPIVCPSPNSPNCPRLTGNSFKSLRIVATIWDTGFMPRCPSGLPSVSSSSGRGYLNIVLIACQNDRPSRC